MSAADLTEDLLAAELRHLFKHGAFEEHRSKISSLLALPRVVAHAPPNPTIDALRKALKGELADVIAELWKGEDERRALVHLFDITEIGHRTMEVRRRKAAESLPVGEETLRKTLEKRYISAIATRLLERVAELPQNVPPLTYPFCGRDKDVETLVAAVCAPKPKPVPLLGLPAIGKTELAIACAHDRRVATRFGLRRYVVPCSASRNAADLIEEIAKVLEVRPDARRVLAELSPASQRGRPALLILDGAETPFSTEVAQLLRSLADVTGLVLVCTLRAGAPPLGVAWGEPLELTGLDPVSAVELFNRVSNDCVADDPHLESLVGQLWGVPWAIELMAHRAITRPSVARLSEEWNRRKTDMLELEGGGVEASLAATFEIAIAGVSPDAQRLLSLMAPLPAGVECNHDLELLLPDLSDAASHSLCAAALAKEWPDRLRLHELIRQHADRRWAPASDDLRRAVEHYCELANVHGPKVGHPEGTQSTHRMTDESANIDWAIRTALEEKLGRGSARRSP